MQRKTFSNAPYEATIKLMAKPDTDITDTHAHTHTHTHTHTQLEVNITDEHRYKNPPQIIANGIQGRKQDFHFLIKVSACVFSFFFSVFFFP